jgi:uncharacterized protein YjbI with pentapeptide repeats
MSLPDKFDAATLESIGVDYYPPINRTFDAAFWERMDSREVQRSVEQLHASIRQLIYVRLAYRLNVLDTMPWRDGFMLNIVKEQVPCDLEKVVSREAKQLFVTQGDDIIAQRIHHYVSQKVESVWHALVPLPRKYLRSAPNQSSSAATRIDSVRFFCDIGEGQVIYWLSTMASDQGQSFTSAAEVMQVSGAFKRELDERLSLQTTESALIVTSRKAVDAAHPPGATLVSASGTQDWMRRATNDEVRDFILQRKLDKKNPDDAWIRPELQSEARYLARAVELWFEHTAEKLRAALAPYDQGDTFLRAVLLCNSEFAPNTPYQNQGPCVLKVVVHFEAVGTCTAEVRGFTHDGQSLVRLTRQGIQSAQQSSSPGRGGGDVAYVLLEESARGEPSHRLIRNDSNAVVGPCHAVTQALIQDLAFAVARQLRKVPDTLRYDAARNLSRYAQSRELAANLVAQTATIDFWFESLKIKDAPKGWRERKGNPARDAPGEFDAATLEALGYKYLPPQYTSVGQFVQQLSAITRNMGFFVLDRVSLRIGQPLGDSAHEWARARHIPQTHTHLKPFLEFAPRDAAGRPYASSNADVLSFLAKAETGQAKSSIRENAEKKIKVAVAAALTPVFHVLVSGPRGVTRVDMLALHWSRRSDSECFYFYCCSAMPELQFDSVAAVRANHEALTAEIAHRQATAHAPSTPISQRLAAVPEALGNLAEKAVSGARSAADTIQREIERRTGFKPIVGYVGDAPRTDDATDGKDIASLSIVELQQRIRPSVKFWRSLFGSLRVQSLVDSYRNRQADMERNLQLWQNEYKDATSEEIRIAKTYFEHSLGELAGFVTKNSQRLDVSRELFDYYTLRQKEAAPGEPFSYRVGVFDGMRFNNRTFDSAREDLKPGEASDVVRALKGQPLHMNACHSDFSGVRIPGAYFYEGVLTGATFYKCDLERSMFGLCRDLSSTIFNQAYLRNAKFVFANPAAAKKKKRHDLMHFVYADLTEARFEHGELENCNFSNARMDKVVFHNMTLIDCDFRGAKGTIPQSKCTVKDCLINDGDKVSTFAELQAYLARDEQPATPTAKTVAGKGKRTANPGASSLAQPLWFCVSEDGRRVAVRTEGGEWLIPPPPNERLIVASAVSDGVAITPFPMLTAYGQLPTLVGDTDDELDDYRMANPKKPVTFPPIFLNVQPHSLGELTGYDVFAAQNAVTLREQPLGWLPLRAALAYSILSKNTGIEQANRALKNMGHLLAAPAFLQAEDIVPRIKMTGIQNDKAAEMVEADRWAYNLSVHAPRLYDAELLRYLCYVTGLPTGIGLAKVSFTLALIGHNLPCLDARLLAVVYGKEQVKAAASSMARLNAKKKAGQLENARTLDRNDAVDVYLDESRRIFAQFAFMPEDAPFYYSRSQWALWERSPIAKRGRAVEATLHTHEEYAELIDAID